MCWDLRERLATATARDPWQSDPRWQPLREAAERMLGVYDWGEAFAVLNLALKPAIDAVVNEQLANLAIAHDDEFLALLLAEFQRDSSRSQNWTSALVQYAVTADPGLADVLRGWLDRHVPPADAAIVGLAELFGTAPRPFPAGQVIDAATQARSRLLADVL